MGTNSRLGAYSNKYGMHRGGEGMGKLVGGGVRSVQTFGPHRVTHHTIWCCTHQIMAHMMGHPAPPPQVTQTVFTTYEGNKTTRNFKRACTNSPVS